MVGEPVLIDRLAHSAEWDWLRVDTGLIMAGSLRIRTVAGSTLVGASLVALFLLTSNRGLVAPRGPLRRG